MAYQLGIPHGAFHTVTAPEHCAWPNLTLLPSGEIGAAIFNQPSHGAMEGDVELWVSEDEGYTWAMRSQITQHEPGTNRMNVAAGLNQKGELIVLCSGWNLDRADRDVVEEDCLLPQVCISGDNGHTWEIVGEVPPTPECANCIPFADIIINDDELAVATYDGEYEEGNLVRCSTFVMRSKDQGRTWGDYSAIDRYDHTEADLLIAANGTWLAGVRTLFGPTDLRHTRRNSQPALLLYASEDEGRTWDRKFWLTHPNQHPPHLLQLADEKILLTYGSRMDELLGVMGRVSEDGGKNWSRPFTLVGGLLHRDCGYPSSVQLENGDIVTAYYSKSSPWHQRYHMGVLRWNLEMVNPDMGNVWG